jgi:hypothetical protein
MADIGVIWDDSAVKLWTETGAPQDALNLTAGELVIAMKDLCPVSPVQAVYASGGATVKGGTRSAGDFPLRPSGYLRSSIHAFKQPDGSVIVGPTASYGGYVNNGTPPHEIHSTGSWPLRNRATGQVFGPVVHHPGTHATHFIENAGTVIAGRVLYVD